MKQKKRYMIAVLCLLCLWAFPVSASEGTVRIQMPQELGGHEVHYEINGEQGSSYADAQGVLTIPGLEPGMYEIQLPEEKFVFMPMEVPVPMWDAKEERMEYDISIIPKYSEITPVPQTGDKSPEQIVPLIGIISCCGAMVLLLLYKKSR